MLVQIALPLVLAFIMFSLGLGLRKEDFVQILKFPLAFGIGLTNQVLLLPLVAFGLAHAFSLSPQFAVGLMILALCPGGVTSNVLSKIARGNAPLSISLTSVTSLLSTITVPFLVAFSVVHFMGDSAPRVDTTKLGITMFLITAVPVAAGMVFTAKLPALVERISPIVSRVAVVLFSLIIVAALIKNWEVFSSNLGTLGPVAVLLNILMLAAGIFSARLAGSIAEMPQPFPSSLACRTARSRSQLGASLREWKARFFRRRPFRRPFTASRCISCACRSFSGGVGKLKFAVSRCAGKWDHIADVLDAGDEHQ